MNLLPYLMIGIANGSIYGLAAVGLVLTYKTSGIFNFAHGAQAALGAYSDVRVPDPRRHAVAGGRAPGAVAGRGGGRAPPRARRLRAGVVPLAARVTATVGLLVFLQGVLIAIFGSASLPVRPFLPQKVFSVGGVFIRGEQIIDVAVIFLAVRRSVPLLHPGQARSRRPGGGRRPGAAGGLAGTSPVAVRRFAWLVGSCFAALSGMLLAPTLALDARLLTLLVFFAFGAAAVGAFSSLPLTYLGGLGLGLGAALFTKIHRPAEADRPDPEPAGQPAVHRAVRGAAGDPETQAGRAGRPRSCAGRCRRWSSAGGGWR